MLPEYGLFFEQKNINEFDNFAESLLSQERMAAYEQSVSKLNDVSSWIIASTFINMGWLFLPGKSFTLNSLRLDLGIASENKTFLNMMLNILKEDGVLVNDNDDMEQWSVKRVPRLSSYFFKAQQILNEIPERKFEIILLLACAEKLPEFLANDNNLEKTVVPEFIRSKLISIYYQNPAAPLFFKYINFLIEEVIALGISANSITILECVEESGRSIRDYLESDFGEYHELNLSDPQFVNLNFDLVIAPNTFHSQNNIQEILTKIEEILAPDGVLVIIEPTFPQRWMDLIMGFTHYWWNYKKNEYRCDHPLLSIKEWESLLFDCGFEYVEVIDLNKELGQPAFWQSFFLARLKPD